MTVASELSGSGVTRDINRNRHNSCTLYGVSVSVTHLLRREYLRWRFGVVDPAGSREVEKIELE